MCPLRSPLNLIGRPRAHSLLDASFLAASLLAVSDIGYGGRQPKFGRRALVLLAPDDEMAARLLSEPMGHGQAQTGTAANTFGGEEGLRRACKCLFVHAVASVGHGKTYKPAPPRDGALVLHRRFFPSGNDDGAAVRHGIARVAKQIDDDESELIGVDVNWRQSAGEPKFDDNGRPKDALQHVSHAMEQNRQLHLLG